LLQHVPSSNIDLDVKSARTIFDRTCFVNGLPSLDDKRFVLIFSRFSERDKIPKEKSMQFFYTLLKKVYKNVHIAKHVPTLSRYFFVIKNTKVTKYYRFKSVIGQGSFGIVHKVVHMQSGQHRVCKSIAKANTSIPSSQIEAEIRIIAELDHPNIVKIYEFFEDEDHVHLIMEYCTNGDLLSRIKTAIKTQIPLKAGFVFSVLKQMLSAVAFMRSHRVLHKDLKPENVMLIDGETSDDMPTVKIIDFGLSEIFSTSQNSSSIVAGTAYYMSPEIFKPPFGFKSDVWSVGVISYFMTTGFLPFFGSTVTEVKSNVLYRKIQWPITYPGSSRTLSLSNSLKELVESLLEKDERIRPEARVALTSPFFTQLHHITASKSFSTSVALNVYSFSRLSWWRRTMVNFIAHSWDFDISASIRAVFAELDKDNKGHISVTDFAFALQGAGLTQTESWRCSKAADLSCSGSITFTSLTASCIYPLISTDRKILKATFHAFSPNRKGRITTDSIYELLLGSRSCISSTISGDRDELRRLLCSEVKLVYSDWLNQLPSISRSFQSMGNPNTTDGPKDMSMEVDINLFGKWLYGTF